MKLDNLLQGSTLDHKISKKLIGDLLKISPEQLFLRKNNLVISSAIYKKFKKAEMAIAKRGLPCQYTIGRGWFYGCEFIINKDVLIPRPETEILLREAIKFVAACSKYPPAGEAGHVSSRKTMQIIDIGTGSGCIAISLAREIAKIHATGYKLPATQIFAVDISAKSLKIAQRNARKYKVNVILLQSDLITNPALPQKFDLILANLPYLPSADIKKENSIYLEPHVALDGGKDGLDLVNKLISQLPSRLAKGGLAILEIDPRQKEKIKKILKKSPDFKRKFTKDLTGRIRFVFIKN